ncbi:MAG TPA: universal stress protein [Acidimicrobiales bacterium]|nr:universal stress protein [Acidimicrobiales bacterium]
MKEDRVGEGSDERGRRVVVGVDRSSAARAALAVAVEEARLRHATVHCVHAWQFPAEAALSTTSGTPVPAAEMKQWAEEVLDDALTAVGVGDDVPVVRDVRIGPAAAVLGEASKGAELLVVGTRGHNRLTGLFLGSVSQYLVVHAPCPVLVVHGPRSATDEAAATGPAGAPGAPGAPGGAVTPGPRGVLEPIPEEECLALLAGQEVGRLVVVRQGVPLVFPVNYTLDGRTLAARTDPGTKLDWATLGHVAVEVDVIDPASHAGWSVVVRGIGRDITDGVDEWSGRVRARDLEPWADGEKEHWIAVASPEISGRRIRPEASAPGAPRGG